MIPGLSPRNWGWSAPAALFSGALSSTAITLSSGDLIATQSTGSIQANSIVNKNLVGGKYYLQFQLDVWGGNATWRPGVINESHGNEVVIGSDANSWGLLPGGTKYHNAVSTAYGSAYSPVAVIGIAVDGPAGKIWFSLGGTFIGDPAAGTGEAFSGLSGSTLRPAVNTFNAGDQTTLFATAATCPNAAPSGFSYAADAPLV